MFTFNNPNFTGQPGAPALEGYEKSTALLYGAETYEEAKSTSPWWEIETELEDNQLLAVGVLKSSVVHKANVTFTANVSDEVFDDHDQVNYNNARIVCARPIIVNSPGDDRAYELVAIHVTGLGGGLRNNNGKGEFRIADAEALHDDNGVFEPATKVNNFGLVYFSEAFRRHRVNGKRAGSSSDNVPFEDIHLNIIERLDDFFEDLR